MPSARRPSLNENISTYGDGTRDFTAFATWEALTDVDLVTAQVSERLVCFADAASFDDRVVLDGAITSIDYNRIISVNPGDEHKGTPGQGVVFSGGISGAGQFVMGEAFVRLYDIASTFTSNATDSRRSFYGNTDSSDCLVVGCLSYDITNSSSGGTNSFDYSPGSVGNKFINCISINPQTAGFILQNGNTPVIVYNCTSIGGAFGFSGGGTQDPILKNCLADGASTSDFTSDYDASSSNNASSDTSAPGTSSRTSQTFTFVDAGNDDYHLAANDVGAKGFGTNLSADATFAFDDDIDGETIGVWSIGFDSEVVSSELFPAPIVLELQVPVSQLDVVLYPVALELELQVPTSQLDAVLYPIALELELQVPVSQLDVALHPEPISLALTLPAASLLTGNTLSPAPIVLALSLPNSQLDVVLHPSPIPIVLALPVPTLDVELNLFPAPIILTLNMPAHRLDMVLYPAPIVLELSVPTSTILLLPEFVYLTSVTLRHGMLDAVRLDQ